MKSEQPSVTYSSWKTSLDSACDIAMGGNFRAARGLFRSACEQAEQLGLKEELIDSLIFLGEAQRLSNQSRIAKTTFTRATLLAEEWKLYRLHAHALASMSKLYIQREQYSEAGSLLLRSLILFLQGREQVQVEDLQDLFALCSVLDLSGQYSKLAVAAQRTREFAEQLVGPRDEAPIFALTYIIVARLLVREWDLFFEASQQLRDAVKNRQTDRLGMRQLVDEALENFGLIGERRDVLALIEDALKRSDPDATSRLTEHLATLGFKPKSASPAGNQLPESRTSKRQRRARS